jgi:hypothetical protein
MLFVWLDGDHPGASGGCAQRSCSAQGAEHAWGSPFGGLGADQSGVSQAGTVADR